MQYNNVTVVITNQKTILYLLFYLIRLYHRPHKNANSQIYILNPNTQVKTNMRQNEKTKRERLRQRQGEKRKKLPIW